MFENVQHSKGFGDSTMPYELGVCIRRRKKVTPLMLAPRWGLEGFRTSIWIKTLPHVGIEISPFLMCIYYRAFLSNCVHFNFMWCNQFFYLPFFHVTCTFFFPSAYCFKCGSFETRQYIFLSFFAHQNACDGQWQT
jgi:hypothetical protein